MTLFRGIFIGLAIELAILALTGPIGWWLLN